MPVRLPGLLHWYERVWWYETPERLHGRGVWRSNGEIVRGIPTDDGYHGAPMVREKHPGGSRLGTPQDGDAFRRYIEGAPTAVDENGYFERPLAAALHAMAHGQGRRSGRPLIARWLYRVARAGFDYRRAADGAGKTHEEAELLTWKGLEILWPKYREYPSRAREAA